MAKVKKTVKKNKTTPVKEEVVMSEEPVYGLINKEDIMSDDMYVKKIMNFLGYDLKRAAGYRYYTKSSKVIKPNFKEREILEVFKR